MPSLSSQLERLRRTIANRRQVMANALDLSEAETLELLALTLAEAAREGAADAFAVRDLVNLLRRLDPQRHPWVAEALEDIEVHIHGDLQLDEALIKHRLEVGRRLLSTHRFMEGTGGRQDFQQLVTTPRGDIQLGLGIGLENGGLSKLLTCLVREGGGRSTRLALKPFFDVETDAIADILESDPALLEEYLRSQLVLRHDSRARRLVHELPDPWPLRFQRLATSLEAKQLQLELTVGPRLIEARKIASKYGLESLRGLAFAFDVQPLLSTERRPSSASGESDRMLGLADRVLARVQGSAYRHWSSRIQALIEGHGQVSGRRYDESELLGDAANKQPWRFEAELSLGDESGGAQPTSVPMPGRDYVIQPGDRLSRLARRAYSGSADYRYLLSANPHLRSPGSLLAGQRIHIPTWPPPRQRIDRGARLERMGRSQLRVRVERDMIHAPGRVLGPFSEEGQPGRCEQIAHVISTLEHDQLQRTRSVWLPEGWALIAENQQILCLTEADSVAASAQCPDSDEPLESWAAWLAAEARGDVILGPDWFLPLNMSKREPFRRRWLRTALLRALTERRLETITITHHEMTRSVELSDDSGQTLVLLCPEDLEQIARQPRRRLGELSLRGEKRALLLARLWISDLRQSGHELLMHPLNDARSIPARAEAGGTRYLAPLGSSVLASAEGEVRFAGPAGAAGNAVLIEHSGRLFSRYTHLASLVVRPGQRVYADQRLGRVGMSGDAMEPGLFFGFERRSGTSATLLAQTWRVGDAEVIDPQRAIEGPTLPWEGIVVGE